MRFSGLLGVGIAAVAAFALQLGFAMAQAPGNPGKAASKASESAAPAKKKKSKCTSGETSDVVKYEVDKGTHIPHAINRSLTGKSGDPETGVKWMVNRKLGNCIACHTITKILDRASPNNIKSLKKFGFQGNVGPTLDGVAGRYNSGELRMIVVNAHKAFPDTIMPSFYSNEGHHNVIKDCKGLVILSADRVEDVVAFLETLK